MSLSAPVRPVLSFIVAIAVSSLIAWSDVAAGCFVAADETRTVSYQVAPGVVRDVYVEYYAPPKPSPIDPDSGAAAVETPTRGTCFASVQLPLSAFPSSSQRVVRVAGSGTSTFEFSRASPQPLSPNTLMRL